jgi:hypothetical protein
MLTVALYLAGTATTHAQLDYERDPIRYSETQPTDRVARLAERLAAGEESLQWDQQHGYLKSILSALDVSQESQTLVFSKTSLQVSRINPQAPRAIYFNDDVYVGWVQHGDVIELSAADPALGGTFYTLSQTRRSSPVIKRETSRCLQCHGSTHTRRIPGHMVRSVYPDRRGLPVFRLGTYLNKDSSPWDQRWGGWYVTGTYGSQRHMGNAYLPDPDESEDLDVEATANLTDLSSLINTTPYLTPHSDIVALMVLQHQATMHNVLTAANHSGRLTERDALVMNQALDRPADYMSDSTMRRYASAAEKVVHGLLFCDEAGLTDPVAGTSGFAEWFAQQGPFDSAGRSLRQFDLQNRLFKYPCSFLVHSEAFAALPEPVRQRVALRMEEILTGQDTSEDFAHLSDSDRSQLLQILRETDVLPDVD